MKTTNVNSRLHLFALGSTHILHLICSFQVGHVINSDYVSFSRSYVKHQRAPLTFSVENVDASCELPSCYGRTFLRVHSSSTSTATEQQPNELFDHVHELRATGADYKDIKMAVSTKFGEARFLAHKEQILHVLSNPAFNSVGLCYRTADNFIKICRSNYFGGLKMSQFVWFLLDQEYLGYGEPILHLDKVRILYVDSKLRNPWNLEKRLYMGGVGDGMNASYMTCNAEPAKQPSAAATHQIDHFIMYDTEHEAKIQKDLLQTQTKATEFQKLYEQGKHVIERLRQNNGETENAVEQEHKANAHMKRHIAQTEKEYTQQMEEQSTGMKHLKQQRQLLKTECRRLQHVEKSLNATVQEMTEMKDVEVAEMNTLRRQLAYQMSLTTELENKALDPLPPPLPPRGVHDTQNGGERKQQQEEQPAPPTRHTNTRGRSSQQGDILNLESEVSFLSMRLKELEKENAELKRDGGENDLLVKALGGKLHALVVENELLKGTSSQ